MLTATPLVTQTIISADTRATASPGQKEPAEELSFSDIVDAINPLQHIPVVSSVIRATMGIGIAPAAQIIGSGIYGGPLGLVSSVANVVLEQATGKDAFTYMADLVTEPSADVIADNEKIGVTKLQPDSRSEVEVYTDISLQEKDAAFSTALVTQIFPELYSRKISEEYRKTQAVDRAQASLVKLIG